MQGRRFRQVPPTFHYESRPPEGALLTRDFRLGMSLSIDVSARSLIGCYKLERMVREGMGLRKTTGDGKELRGCTGDSQKSGNIHNWFDRS